MRRITLALMIAVVMLVTVAVPAMAQGDDKAARKAERQAQKKAQKAQKTDSAPKKATPETGGVAPVDAALLGMGVLLVGGGLVAYRTVRR